MRSPLSPPCYAVLTLISALCLSITASSVAREDGAATTSGPSATQRRAAGAQVLILAAPDPRHPSPGPRSREQARAKAESALAKAREKGVPFAEVVAKFSEDPRGQATGGRFGVLDRGRINPSLKSMEDALFALKIGEVSGIVETPLGFHILKRLAIEEVAARHIIVSHKDVSGRKIPGITRTRQEAKRRAEAALARLSRPGADRRAVAQEYTDEPSFARSGGLLGVFQKGTLGGEFAPLGKAVFALEVGEVSEIVESPLGFHIVWRIPISEVRIGARHILVMHKGSQRVPAGITRTEEEARARAITVRDKARAKGADFAALAKEYSDGPSGPSGGELGLFTRGRMVPAFEAAAFALKKGEVSDIVQTPFGFHVILRTQ